jgi:hypothetical protein
VCQALLASATPVSSFAVLWCNIRYPATIFIGDPGRILRPEQVGQGEREYGQPAHELLIHRNVSIKEND